MPFHLTMESSTTSLYTVLPHNLLWRIYLAPDSDCIYISEREGGAVSSNLLIKLKIYL